MEKEDLSQLKISRSEKEPASYRRSNRKRFVWVLLIVLLLGLIGLGYTRGYLRPSQEVSVTTVSLVYPSQPITLLNASGYVVAQRKAAVASKGTGRLETLAVEEGSRVKKGQILARLENASHHVVKLTRILCRCHINLNDRRIRCKRGPCHGRINWRRKAFQNQTA